MDPLDPIALASLWFGMSQSHVIHFCGRMFPFDLSLIDSLAVRVAETLERFDVIGGVGSMACGADLLIAEALVTKSAKLHVVLPFAPEDFAKSSVMIGGAGWLARYDALLPSALSVETLGYDPSIANDMIPDPYRMTSHRAIGDAVALAKSMNATPLQIAIHDGLPSDRIVGTMADIREWNSLGLRTELIKVAPEVRLTA